MDYHSRDPPSLLTIPLELRLMICGHLLAPRSRHHRFAMNPESCSNPYNETHQDDRETLETAVDTSFIAVVRYIPAVILSRTCRQLRWEITSMIKREQLFVPRNEPLRLLFDPSEYKIPSEAQKGPNSVQQGFNSAHPTVLNPPRLSAPDQAFLSALCARHLRMQNFPQTTENADLRLWITKAQYYRECFWTLYLRADYRSNLGKVGKRGRCLIDPHIEIRLVVRQESGQVDCREPPNSDSAVVHYGHSALLNYLRELYEARPFRKIWYQARSLTSGYIGNHYANHKDLVVADTDISEDEWLRDWEGDGYRDHTFFTTHLRG